MILETSLTFSNNGIASGTYDYSLTLDNIIEHKEHTFTGSVTISSTRYIIITLSTDSEGKSITDYVKGKYKCELTVNEETVCNFIGIKEFSTDNKYRYDEQENRYIYE